MNSDINRPGTATDAQNNPMAPGESLEPLANVPKAAEVTAVPFTSQVMKAMVYRSHRKGLFISALVALLVLSTGIYLIHRADEKAAQARIAQQTVTAKLADPAKEVLTINSQLKVLHQAEIGTLNVDTQAVVGDDLTVKGAATIGNGLSVSGNGNFSGNITAANFNTSSLQVNGSGNFSGSLNVNNVTATSITINGNGNFSGNLNIAGTVQGNVLDGNTFAVNGVAGASVICTGGQVLANADIQSGIVVGGNCVTVASGGGPSTDLQTAYDNSTSPEITLNNANGALTLRDTLAGLGGNLLEVQNNAGTTTYFAVSSAGVNATSFSGNGSAVTNVDAVSLQGNAASFFTDAGNLATGTLADGRLSSNVALLGAAANFTSTLQHNGNDVCDASGNCTTAGAAGGDLTGTYPNPTIAKLQGGTLTIATLASGNYLRYNGIAWANSALQAGDLPGGSGSYIQNGTTVQTGASFFIQPSSGNVAAVLKANGADTLDIQNSSGVVVSSFDSTGNLMVPNVTVASQGTISFVGGLTSQRPASPTDGMLYYDTTTHQLLQYSSGLSKWVSDRSTANKIVAMGTATGCSGTSPVASSNADGADYVITSCTSAQTTINSAISALPASGGTVYLEDGTYVFDGSVNIPSNVTITGAGAATTLIYKDGIANPGFNLLQNSDSVNGNTRINISNLRIDGNQVNQTVSMSLIKLTKVGSTTTNTPGFTISNIWAENSFGDALSTVNSAHGTITGSVFSGNGQGGFSAMNLNGGGYIAVTGNTVQNTRSQGIVIAGTNNTISGNTFRNNARSIYLNGTTDSTVTGNSISGNSTTGITVFSTSGSTISGNSISNGGIWGVQILLGSKNLVTGNTFDANNGDSIYLQSTSNNIISGNDINNISASAYFINVFDSASTTNTLSNNTFNGTATHYINDAGTSTIYSNQQDGSGNLIVKSQGGGMAVGASSANASLTLQGGLNVQTLPAPAAPTVTTVGTPGTTTWGYKVTALDGVGETVGSTETQITTGNATLSAINYNKISWNPVSGAYQYKVYRTTAGGTPNIPGSIATVSGNVTTANDQGIAGNFASPFGNNTTGSASIAGSLSVANGGVTISTQMIRMTGQANFYGPSGNYAIIGSGASGRINVTDAATFPGTSIVTDKTNQVVEAVREASGQTADLLDLQNSSTNVMTKFNANGDLIIGGTNSAASSNAFQVQDTSGVAFLTVNSSTLTLTVKNVVITASLTVNGHIISGNSSGSTTIAAGAAATCTLTSPTVSITGNDTAGTVSITTATGVCSAGDMADITYANAYGSAPSVVISAGNAAAAGLQYYWNSVAGNFAIKTANNPTTATTYIFSYHVFQ